ncbi:MAG: DNA replication/repair protein RecF [Firmicutes bacterium]|nr:DNA replication/repair protein RecF [Dethiobacter sp.]MBS3888839.1 DNA replication/repair protein RecF [Bacillota bacterium]MBS4054956.1 DNA replication/repair protein RecF [Thermaerobacter sp.]
MWIREVTLINFRNYAKETIVFSPGINLIIGSNGEGKTNLLESIFLLATTRSYRQSHERDMVALSCDSFYVSGAATLTGDIKHTLELAYSQVQKKKQVKVSGVPVTRLTDFMGILNVVFFSPEDLNLVKGPKGLRRRFLDILLSQIDKLYLYTLQQYTRVLKQRNECLKSIQRGTMRTTDLAPWNEQFASLAERIVRRRAEAVTEIAKYFAVYSRAINQGKEILALEYISQLLKVKDILSNVSIHEVLLKKQQEDIARGLTSVGPHRDDLLFTINGLQAAEYASQGQQRTAVLGLKMAELEYMYKVTGDYPILLLDDVFSELDQSRRELLLSTLHGKVQALVTGTEVPAFSLSPLEASPQLIRVRQGKVI